MPGSPAAVRREKAKTKKDDTEKEDKWNTKPEEQGDIEKLKRQKTNRSALLDE